MSTTDPADSRSIADDAGFADRLIDLDEGLGGPDDPLSSRPRPPSAFHASPLAAAPRGMKPLPPVVTAPGRRPLLELFPAETNEAFAPPVVARRAAAASAPPPRTRLQAPPLAPAPSSAPGAATTYEAFYGLRERPFTLSTDPKFLYQSTAYDTVVQQMLGAIGQREPLVLLTGETGVGKTTLCRALLDQLDSRTLTSVVTDPFTSIEELLKRLLIDFGVVSRDDVARGHLASATESELRAALGEFLQSLGPLEAFAVVVIDDAQALQPAVLDGLERLVSADRAMQIVLVGQPALAAALDGTRRRAGALAKAVSLRCELGFLADDEVGGYIMHRLRVAGTHPRVEFDDAALRRIFTISGGKPRLVNLLCDRALAGGFARQAGVIDEALVDLAAEQLDMAPPAPKHPIFGNLSAVTMLILLLVAGAAAGALVFHRDIEAILGGR